MADVTLEEMEEEFASSDGGGEGDVEGKSTESSQPSSDQQSMGSIVAELEATKRALQISEEARKGGSSNQQPATKQEPAQPPFKVLNEEELDELYENEPKKAMKYMIEMAKWEADQHYSRRISQLQGAQVGSIEQQARQTYATEFDLFGDEIKSFVDSLPDKSALSSMQGWEDVVAYVRGRKGNIEKYVDAVTAGAKKAERDSARGAQHQSSGVTFTGRGQNNTTVANAAPELDDVERRIGQEFVDAGIYKTVDEYARSLKRK